MLMLYRPPQTRVPLRRQHIAAQQAGYQATRRVPVPPPPPPAPVKAAVPSADLVADLTKLGELHRSGVLTDDEFAAFKAKLLAR